MGLDMYLKANKYAGDWNFCEPSERKTHQKLLTAAGMSKEYVAKDSPAVEVSVTVAYWRKSNQIHAWFVRECAGGEDNCEPAYVPREKLLELRNLCADLLTRRDHEEASQKLPPQQGFFFGSYDIDEFYWGELESTVEQLDKVLQLNEAEWEFYYRASW